MTDVLDGLNENQAEAVKYINGPLLVLAGAGSGKTKVLTTKIAYLLKEMRISPFNVLAITFTNKAANEMRERVAAAVPDAARDIWILTFHAACVRILRRQAYFLGYNGDFVIYDDADRQTLLKDCLKELNYDNKKFSPRAVGAVISRAKNNLMDSEEFKEQANGFYELKVAEIYEFYQSRLLKNNALDFDDLIMQTVRLFEQNPSILAYYQNKFRYILVDEYQDTNTAQYVLVKLLAAAHRSLFVVGDPDQSIYGWRGANIRNILNFEKDYHDARIIKLEQNYRSTQVILDVANEVISNNSSRKEKDLWTAEGQGTPVMLYLGPDEHQEAQFIADRIRSIREHSGANYRDFAVLYRTHAMSRVVEEIFLREMIPYTIIGGLKFYDRKEIKDLLAYLRLLVNPADTVSLSRVINMPKRGVGEASFQKLSSFALEQNIAILEVLERSARIPGLTSKVRQACLSLADVLNKISQEKEMMNVTEITQRILQQTGYWQELVSENTVESRTRQENLKEFMSVTKEFDKYAGHGSLSVFLAEMALSSDIDWYKDTGDQVVLMTLHSAKGLEFPNVFLIGLEEGVFPYSRSLDEQFELEEERRLCYVGITRAKRQLYLTHCWQRTLYGVTRFNKPSRFLEEIPERLIMPEDSLNIDTAGHLRAVRKSFILNKI
ncbi:MAG TPA: DNA helicase PcrA [Desulfotomaculum sp.]|nr:MAG: ATP-dependent DNA helicase PcrA [Desulfotomaculum sp. 46_80]KUK84957.1 MAG: ATP-dependent DNA helicase PcrA [Desulfofundulus kuznetsovii]HAG10736.1 DNA helicase PcrA [Desulfotomaculum sp.]HBY03907.1 DNA helicase PcrA [Desulfotomaculum sp.]